jgi:mono/diheme cytochrome c family protein
MFAGGGRGTGVGGSMSGFFPSFGPTVELATAPPAVSGGTLRVLADGRTAVAADPDRDLVYVVDLPNRSLRATITLAAGDEPGRVIEDASGRVHIALRRGGAIGTIDALSGMLTDRRSVCAAPRGLAYDPGSDLVYVACRDGELVSLPAAGGAAVRTLILDQDLRDVVVRGTELLVSRFRSAELLTVEADGTISGRVTPPNFQSLMARNGEAFTPSVAWQTIAAPDGTTVMLHQRGDTSAINPIVGGYGGTNPCNSILHPAVTAFAPDGTVASGPALAGMVLAVDMALSPDGTRIAFVSMGNATNRLPGGMAPQLTRVFETSLSTAVDGTIGCNPDGVHGPCSTFIGTGTGGRAPPTGGSSGTAGTGGAGGMGGATGAGGLAGSGSIGGTTGGIAGTGTGGRMALPGSSPACSTTDPSVPTVVGEPIAIAYAGDGTLVVQSREPAMLAFPDGTSVVLAGESRADTGHQVFHANAGGFIACASCHPEGNEDGRVWSFACTGPRRTQSLQTGLRGTEPFHWSGDETDFSHLMTDVFVGRMSGPVLAADQGDALLSWLDAQPRPPRSTPADAAAVERGRLLFEDTKNVGCVTCHAGSHFTNSATVDVGTGGLFQVPSLVGVGTRAPFMHSGCATTLRDRFSPACGGSNHGVTSQLSEAQISDLIAYLETL